MGFDEGIMRAVSAGRADAVTQVIQGIGNAGMRIEVLEVVALAAVLAVVATRSWRVGGIAAASLLLGDLIAHWLKQVVRRPRPAGDLTLWPEIHSWAMPSTHAAATSALAMAVFLAVRWRSGRMRRAAGIALATAVVFVGGCMVYLGAHWPTDVLAGWLLGAGIGASVAWTAGRLRPNRNDLSSDARDTPALR
ncbi:phosphatase PAP2 family protein [Nocardia anaemiae]|uniref:phosphatase PAP2 family protein n=1 Tax=Nocardia anaemiae TaxID=263910 RepID=UPI001470D947|nr:phosphatase PAP2 family protein [Nocardia anaemiae]